MHIHLTPTALAKAKALGVVAAALTAGGAGGMVALSQVSNTASSTDVVVSSDTTTAPTTDPTATDTPTPTETQSATDAATSAPAPTTFALPSCPADVKNHGAYVSGVARSAPKGKDGEHGMWVSQAAHSDCGKSADSSAKPEPTETDSPDTERPDTHSPKPDHSQPEKTDSPDATTTVGGGASVSTDTGGKHNTGHGDH